MLAYEVHHLLDSSGEDDDEPIMDGSDDEPDNLEIEEENYDDTLQQFIPSQHSTDSNSVLSSLLNISPHHQLLNNHTGEANTDCFLLYHKQQGLIS